MMVKKPYIYKSVVLIGGIEEKSLFLIGEEDSLKDGLIKTTITAGISFLLEAAANVKPPKASLDAILAGGISEKVLVKDYAVYKKWIKE